jgi:hypothetical protein
MDAQLRIDSDINNVAGRLLGCGAADRSVVFSGIITKKRYRLFLQSRCAYAYDDRSRPGAAAALVAVKSQALRALSLPEG